MATQIDELELYATIENIGVRSNFSGDPDGNNVAILEYKKVGSASWKPGIPMTVDRRELFNTESGGQPNPYKNQWRAVIFWLTPNTEYEVRVTYSDPDGVSGTNPVVATVKTRNDNPPSNGTNYYVSPSGDDSNPGTEALPFRTIQKGANIVVAGDIVNVMSGTYNERIDVELVSGTEDNYIWFRSYDMQNKAIVDGQKLVAAGFALDQASYIRISGFVLKNTTLMNINLAIASNYDIIEDCVLSEGGEGWGNGGILIMSRGGSGDRPSVGALIQRNEITRYADSRDQEMGIFFFNNAIYEGGHVIRDNVIKGNFKDGIGGSPNGGLKGTVHANTFIYRNYIEGADDDAIEIEGADINCAIWGNTLINPHHMCFGLAPVHVGPLYIFRNICSDWLDAAFKMGGHSDGYVYVYHNTLSTQYNTNGAADFGHTSVVDNFVFRNNIFDMGKFAIYQRSLPTTNNYDYDNLYKGPWPGLFLWGPAWPDDIYDTLEEFQAVSGQEMHGISADTQFVNRDSYDFRLQSTSPSINRGVVLPGFNDKNSPWPYKGTGPDMGAIESGVTAVSPLADFSYDPISGIVPLTVVFTNLSTGEIDSWLWNFGDGQTSAELNPTHIYTVPGDYVVTLRVSGPSGSDTKEALVSVFSTPFILTIEAAPGGTTDPAPGQLTLNEGTIVLVTALPDAGYRFLEWREGVAIGSENPISIVMDSDRTITPVFELVTPPPGEFIVTISVLGEGSTEPPVEAYSIIDGESLTITAIPSTGNLFDHWEGNVTGVANPITIQITSNISIVAVFVEKPPQMPFLVSASILASVLGIISSLIRSRR